jgi:hypothetical protein
MKYAVLHLTSDEPGRSRSKVHLRRANSGETIV